MFSHPSTTIARRRLAVTGLLASALLLPGSALAEGAPTGTIIGRVTCGPAEETAASHALVWLQGSGLSVHTDSAGTFTISGAPASETLIVNAAPDAQGAAIASRFNVKVGPHETLDIGSLDLVVCPQPVDKTTVPQPDEFPSDYWDQF